MRGVFLAVAALLALAGCKHELTEVEQLKAEKGAREFAERDGGKFVSCSGMDSNGDSYVSCTYQDKAGATLPLQCSFAAVGCKPGEKGA